MSAPRGFVLVNALVLVAALSAAALTLLHKAETGRTRLEAGQRADRLALALGAFEALSLRRLSVDAPGLDHAGEIWADPVAALPLDPGTVSGRVADMQGRFNLNWLADPDNTAAQAAFDRLIAGLGLSPATGDAIRGYLRPGGPEDATAWQMARPARDPVGGAVLLVEQLRDIPGLSPAALSRLSPHVTALPGDSRLNVNTATGPVLGAFLPRLTPTLRAALLSRRARDPFASVEAFELAVGIERNDEGDDAADDPDLPDTARLSVASEWFLATATVTLDRASATRRTLLRRPAPGRVEIAWRIDTRP